LAHEKRDKDLVSAASQDQSCIVDAVMWIGEFRKGRDFFGWSNHMVRGAMCNIVEWGWCEHVG
jgi:hypothetical protein